MIRRRLLLSALPCAALLLNACAGPTPSDESARGSGWERHAADATPRPRARDAQSAAAPGPSASPSAERPARGDPSGLPFGAWHGGDDGAAGAACAIHPAEGYAAHGIVRFREADEEVAMRIHLEELQPNTVFALLLGPEGPAARAAPTLDGAREDRPTDEPPPPAPDEPTLLGFFYSEEDGTAYGEYVLDHFRLTRGPDGVLGRELVVTTVERISGASTLEAGAARDGAERRGAQPQLRVHLGELIAGGLVEAGP